MSLLTICAVDVRRAGGAYDFSFWVLDEGEPAGRFLSCRVAQGERDGPHSSRWVNAVWLTVAGTIGRSWPYPPCAGPVEVTLDRSKLAQLLTSTATVRTIEPLAVILLYAGRNPAAATTPTSTLQGAIDAALAAHPSDGPARADAGADR